MSSTSAPLSTKDAPQPYADATPEGHAVYYDEPGRVTALTLVNVQWLAERVGALKITWPEVVGHVPSSQVRRCSQPRPETRPWYSLTRAWSPNRSSARAPADRRLRSCNRPRPTPGYRRLQDHEDGLVICLVRRQILGGSAANR